MLSVAAVLVMLFSALLSISVRWLLTAALWLAVTSAGTAALLYMLGAHEIAVIEFSVGTGLVPVLFVFAMSLMGRASSMPTPIIPRTAAGGLALLCLALLGLTLLPINTAGQDKFPITFSQILWQDRSLDMLVQIVLIFAGIISVLNILRRTDTEPPGSRHDH
ncbi:MAG: NADH-quinone oxidoreductase subunit J [Anaerolineae bacterium]|nr:NADH-quinone oxidoreductase subunit J [Anaerolineae bacterium]